MRRKSSEDRCSSCDCQVAAYDGVYVSDGEASRFLCFRCNNEKMSRAAGVDFDHPVFHPMTLKDSDGEEHTFHFQTRLFGRTAGITAREMRAGVPRGYAFSAQGDLADGLPALFTKLVGRMHRELRRKHIESGEQDRYTISGDHTLRGRITWTDETDGHVPCIVIDGKELSWQEFGTMLMAFEEFHFKLEIYEGTEER